MTRLHEALMAKADWAQKKAEIHKRANARWAEAGNEELARVAWESYMECIAERNAYLEAAKMTNA